MFVHLKALMFIVSGVAPEPPEPILGFKNCENIAHKLQLAVQGEDGEVVQCLEHHGTSRFW